MPFSATWLRSGLSPWSRPLLYGGLILAGSASVRGQFPPAAATPTPRRHNLSLEAVSVATGGKTQISNQGSKSGAYGGTTADTRVVKSQQNVQFTVRNYDALPDTVTVDWYFIAAPVGMNGVIPGKEYLLNQGSQPITVEGTKTETQIVSSKEVEVVTKRSAENTLYVTYLSQSQGGALVQGWMVRLIADGKVIATRGSSQKFEDIAKDDAKLNALAPRTPGAINRRPAATAPGPRPTDTLLPGLPTPPAH